MSIPNLDQLTAAQAANAEAMMALVRTAFNGVERLTALNIAASRDIFNNTVANTQHLLGAKDPSDLSRLNTELAKPNLDKWVEYSRNVYDLVAQLQKEMTTVVESQYSAFSQSASSAVEKATANTPVGGLIFAAAMKSMLSASTQAFQNLTSVTKQFSDIAEANINAASSATAQAVSATSAAARKASK